MTDGTEYNFVSTNAVARPGYPIYVYSPTLLAAYLSNSANNGKVYKYLGETNAYYLQGTIYECTAASGN